jgi:hypothetical protein
MFAILEFQDYVGIFGIVNLAVCIIVGGIYSFRPSDAARLARQERKLDALLRHLKVEYVDPASSDGLSDEVKRLADDPRSKIAAIKLHREQTGLGLKEAKEAVEAYIDHR